MFFSKNKEEPTLPLSKPRKKNEDDNLEWDKKKIFITLCLLVAAFVIYSEVKAQFFPNFKIGDNTKSEEIVVEKPSVKPPDINLQSEVSSRIEDIKQNIEGLNATEVASSSPQIQKVLRDIQGIKDLPSNEAKEMCLKVCGGL